MKAIAFLVFISSMWLTIAASQSVSAQTAGGSNTNIQYNSSGLLAGSNAFTFTGGNAVTLNASGSYYVAVDSANSRATYLTTNQGGGFPALVLDNGSGSSWQMYDYANNGWASIYNSGNAYFTFTTSGAFGVNTDYPTGTLDVEPSGGNGRATSCLNGVCTSSYRTDYTDLRIWSSLSCNPSAPSSTNVDTAITNAHNAGWNYFFMPPGCYWLTSSIPDGYHFLGADLNTSGIAVVTLGTTPSSSQHITFGSNVELRNMFYWSYECYNLDSGAFGHPGFCPLYEFIASADQNGTSQLGSYPYQGLQFASGPTNVGSVGGTWNGTDNPMMGMTQEGEGDVFFVNNIGGANFLNLYNSNGQVFQLQGSGFLAMGNASMSHASGSFSIQDNTGKCTFFANGSGPATSTCTSDRRLKKAIVDAGDQIKWLNSFRVRDFTLTADNSRHTGVVAQEVMQAHSDMVYKDPKTGYYEVSGPNEWKMVRAMQQMQVEIEKLKHELQRSKHHLLVRMSERWHEKTRRTISGITDLRPSSEDH